MMAAPVPDLIGTRVDDRYTIEEVLGSGGHATVYRARHLELGMDCALKVLTVSHPSLIERLRREGRTLARLKHQNVVQVFDVVRIEVPDPRLGLVLELVNGGSLDRLIGEHPFTDDEIDALAGDILNGMIAAHATGLVHRDLKPGNVLLQDDGRRLIAKIADFGLVKLLEDGGEESMSLTSSRAAMGTPLYMAPEQFLDARHVDQRADVWALGAILYELPVGLGAFSGTNQYDVHELVAEGRFTPPRILRPDLPARMERAIVGALQPRVERRIASCEELFAFWNADKTPLAPFRRTTLAKAAEAARRGQKGAGRDDVDSAGPTTLSPAPVLGAGSADPRPAPETRAGLSQAISVSTLDADVPLEPPRPPPPSTVRPPNESRTPPVTPASAARVERSWLAAGVISSAVIGAAVLALSGVSIGAGYLWWQSTQPEVDLIEPEPQPRISDLGEPSREDPSGREPPSSPVDPRPGPVSRQVQVPAGEEPKASPEAPRPPAPQPQPEPVETTLPGVQEPAAPETPSPQPALYKITFAAIPRDARVTVDGRELGESTPTSVLLTPGEHTVQMSVGDRTSNVQTITVTKRGFRTVRWHQGKDTWDSWD